MQKYKIIGSDQKEYGPVTFEQMRKWISEGRVNAKTQVQAEGDSAWRSLGDVPELSELLRTGAPPPPPAPAQPPSASRTSGLAIGSLVLGILGIFTCGISAIAGLILGIVAMVKIKKSDGRLGGNGLALAGTIVSAVFLLMLPIFAAMLLPALAKAKEKAQTILCMNNMKQLSIAMRMYATESQNQLPPAETWCDAIKPHVNLPQAFQCPAANDGQRSHFAFNAKLGRLNYDHVPPDTVVLFETQGGWNVHGGRELMLQNSRHGGTFLVAFADGSVRELHQSELGSLRWEP